ncbi:MAG: hypothetical protein ACK55I_07485, partial [bacterium]
MDAGSQRTAKLHDRKIDERAASLVVAHLFEQVGLRTEGLIEIARDARHGLEHREIGSVHPSGAMPGQPRDVCSADRLARGGLLRKRVAPVRERQREDPARLKLRRGE